ncbi:Melatonin receptor type 1A [Manis javanica]|nr:Melatonin receptor type 1A [Manis javanica]
MLVVSLAIADLVVAVYPYPLVLTSSFNNGWNLGYLHCQMSAFLMGLSAIGSIFSITGIAINHYGYISHSLMNDKLYSNKDSLCCVFLIWILTLVAIVPNVCIGTLQYDPRISSCTSARSVS